MTFKKFKVINVSCDGIVYKVHQGSISDHGTRNSLVVLGDNVQSQWEPCQIEAIYTMTLDALPSTSKIVIHLYEKLTDLDTTLDPYRAFPVAGGRICYSTFQPSLQLVSPNDILCHFASTPCVIEKLTCLHMHVLPLDHVSILYCLLNSCKLTKARIDLLFPFPPTWQAQEEHHIQAIFLSTFPLLPISPLQTLWDLVHWSFILGTTNRCWPNSKSPMTKSPWPPASCLMTQENLLTVSGQIDAYILVHDVSTLNMLFNVLRRVSDGDV